MNIYVVKPVKNGTVVSIDVNDIEFYRLNDLSKGVIILDWGSYRFTNSDINHSLAIDGKNPILIECYNINVNYTQFIDIFI